jgi:hypothetical protein
MSVNGGPEYPATTDIDQVTLADQVDGPDRSDEPIPFDVEHIRTISRSWNGPPGSGPWSTWTAPTPRRNRGSWSRRWKIIT